MTPGKNSDKMKNKFIFFFNYINKFSKNFMYYMWDDD